MIPTLTSFAASGLFIFAMSGIITRCSRSTTAGSTFLLDGVGVPAVGCGCGCGRRSAWPDDCTAQPAARATTTRVLRNFMMISFP